MDISLTAASTFSNSSWITNIVNEIGSWLYGLFSIFFLVIDWLQSLFRSLAGLEGIMINGTEVNASDSEAKYDIIFYLIQSDVVIDVFVSMLVFMVVMLVLFTAIALIKNLYQEKSKPPMEIINKAFKALWTVFIVPVTLIVGLMFGNIILQAVDEGTRTGGSSRMSSTLFIASAYDANVLRNYETQDEWCENCFELIQQTNFLEIDGVSSILNNSQYLFSVNLMHVNEDDYDTLATILDDSISTGELKYTKGDNSKANDKVVDFEDRAGTGLKYCYKLGKINYLVLAFGGGTIVGIFIKICWGMIGRIFKCIFDVVLIPVVCAIMPLDDGKAVGSWKSDIIKNVTMAYSTVGILNIYFSILPVVNNIKFTAQWASGILNSFTLLILQIIGIATASSMIGTVNGWIGGLGVGDVLGEGKKTQDALKDGWKQITDKVNAKKRMESTAKFIGAYRGGAAQAKKEGKSGFWAGMTSAMGTTGAGKKFGEFAQAVPKAVGEGRDAGKKSYQARQTYVPFDPGSERAEAKKAQYALQGEFAKMDKILANYATDEEKNEAMANSDFITNITKNGGEMDWYDSSGNRIRTTIDKVDKEIAALDKKSKEIDGYKSTIGSTSKAEAALKAVQEDYDKLFDITYDLVTGAELSRTKKGDVSTQQIIAAERAIKDAEFTLNKSYSDSLMSMFKYNTADFNALTGNTTTDIKDLSDILDGMSDADLKNWFETIKTGSSMISDIKREARQQATKLEDMKDKAIKEKAEVYKQAQANLAKDPNASKYKPS